MTRGFLSCALALFAVGCQEQPATTDHLQPEKLEQLVAAVPDSLLACRTAEFGDTRLRHPHPVVSIALTDDGKQLATATAHEPVVRLWDVASSELISEFRLDAKVPSSFRIVGFSPDGAKLLTWCVCPSPFSHIPAFVPVTIDCRTGGMKNWPWSLFVEGHRIPELSILPNGRDVLQRGTDIEIFDLETGVLRKAIKASADPWNPLLTAGYSVSPDGTQLASCNWTSGISIYSLERECKSHDLSNFTQNESYRQSSLAWLSTETLLESHNGNISIIDAESGQVLTKLGRKPDEYLAPVAVSDRAFYVRSMLQGHITKFDVQSLKLQRAQFPSPDLRVAHREEHSFICRVSKNDLVFASTNGNTVLLFDASTGQSLHHHVAKSILNNVVHVRFSQDGSRFLASDLKVSQIWETGTKRLLNTYSGRTPGLGQYGHLPNVHFSPKGSFIATASEGDGRIVVRDAATNIEIAREPEYERETGSRYELLDFFDDETLLVKEKTNGPVATIRFRKWDVSTRTETTPLAAYQAASGRSKRVAFSSRELTWMDVAKDLKPAVLSQYEIRTVGCGLSPSRYPIPLRFSDDGRFLAVWDNGFDLWDLEENKVRKMERLSGFQLYREWFSRDVSFSPDGTRMIAIFTEPNTNELSVRSWDTGTGKELFRFQPPGGATVCEFHPDGKHLLIAHPNSTFSLWDYSALEKQLMK